MDHLLSSDGPILNLPRKASQEKNGENMTKVRASRGGQPICCSLLCLLTRSYYLFICARQSPPAKDQQVKGHVNGVAEIMNFGGGVMIPSHRNFHHLPPQ